MGDLTNKQIDLSYDGLIKTNDEDPINGTLKTLQDGVGNDLPMQVSTSEVNFTGTVTGDNNTTYGITTSTVDQWTAGINLNGSDASTDQIQLTAGTGIDISEANDIITVDAQPYTMDLSASVDDAEISLIKNGNITVDAFKIIAGNNITLDVNGLADTVTINSAAGGTPGLIQGQVAESIESNLTTDPAVATETYSIAIGSGAESQRAHSISIGRQALTTDYFGVAIGSGNVAFREAVAIGYNADATSIYSTAIGSGARGTAEAAVALGRGVEANRANTTSVNLLEVQEAGGSIIMYSPNGTAWNITVDDAGNLIVA